MKVEMQRGWRDRCGKMGLMGRGIDMWSTLNMLLSIPIVVRYETNGRWRTIGRYVHGWMGGWINGWMGGRKEYSVFSDVKGDMLDIMLSECILLRVPVYLSVPD